MFIDAQNSHTKHCTPHCRVAHFVGSAFFHLSVRDYYFVCRNYFIVLCQSQKVESAW